MAAVTDAGEETKHVTSRSGPSAFAVWGTVIRFGEEEEEEEDEDRK